MALPVYLPDVHFGGPRQTPIDWRSNTNPDDDRDDDDELMYTPPHVTLMLGFDPKDIDVDDPESSSFGIGNPLHDRR